LNESLAKLSGDESAQKERCCGHEAIARMHATATAKRTEVTDAEDRPRDREKKRFEVEQQLADLKETGGS